MGYKQGSYVLGETIYELRVGDSACIEKIFDREDAYHFGLITKDMNPVYINDVFAEKSWFGKIIMQGSLVSRLISAVIRTKLPGFGCIYKSKTLDFLIPVFVGDRIYAKVTVIEKKEEKNRCKLKTICFNQPGETVIDGYAVVIPRSNDL